MYKRQLVDHRSYKRRGIDKIPSVHLGPAASQMEKRGIRTDKGEVNRQITADNMLDDKYNLLQHPNIRFTEDGGALPYDYTEIHDARDDLSAPFEDYELLEPDSFEREKRRNDS